MSHSPSVTSQHRPFLLYVIVVITDTIEIDPAVAEAARRVFHFEPTGLFLVGDARHETKNMNDKIVPGVQLCFTGAAAPGKAARRCMEAIDSFNTNDQGKCRSHKRSDIQ